MAEMRESSRSLQAFSDYVAMGPGRSLRGLLERYRTDHKPATRRFSTLRDWSAAHRWQERVTTHERQIAAEAERRAQQERLAELERFRLVQKQLGAELQRHAIEAVRRAAAAGSISPAAAVQMVRVGAELLWRGLGQPEQTLALGVDLRVDLSTLSDDELDDRIHRLRLLTSPRHPGA
jgi:hypothetical protein